MVGLVCKAVVVRVTEINHHGWTVCKAAVVRVTEINHHGWTGVQGGSSEGDGD